MTHKIKGNPLLSVRLPIELNQLLNDQVTLTGESRSDIAIAALINYLQPPTVEDELPQLKRRLLQVETALQKHLQEEAGGLGS